MKERYVIVTIDTIAELLKDYVANEEDIPADSQPLRMLINPSNHKLAIEFESPTIKDGSPPLDVHFRIKRVYGVT